MYVFVLKSRQIHTFDNIEQKNHTYCAYIIVFLLFLYHTLLKMLQLLCLIFQQDLLYSLLYFILQHWHYFVRAKQQ